MTFALSFRQTRHRSVRVLVEGEAIPTDGLRLFQRHHRWVVVGEEVEQVIWAWQESAVLAVRAWMECEGKLVWE